MRFVLMLLLIAAVPAWAEWVKVTEAGGISFYIDRATIRKKGDMRRVWVLQDLKEAGYRSEMSRRGLEEYDCEEERYRILTASSHSGPMAGGDVLGIDDSPGEWSYIGPGTPAAIMLGIVCSK